jgi:hypothetical protein
MTYTTTQEVYFELDDQDGEFTAYARVTLDGGLPHWRQPVDPGEVQWFKVERAWPGEIAPGHRELPESDWPDLSPYEQSAIEKAEEDDSCLGPDWDE